MPSGLGTCFASRTSTCTRWGYFVAGRASRFTHDGVKTTTTGYTLAAWHSVKLECMANALSVGLSGGSPSFGDACWIAKTAPAGCNTATATGTGGPFAISGGHLQEFVWNGSARERGVGHKSDSSLDFRYGNVGGTRWLLENVNNVTYTAITRDANGAATTATVVWPDGTTGTYTATTVSSAFPGAVDAYTVTYGTGGATKTVTQAAVTRDAGSGAVTAQSVLVVS